MRCESAARWLDAFRTGELKSVKRKSLAAHLERCPACARELAGIESLAGSVLGLRVCAPGRILERVLEVAGDHYATVATDLGTYRVAFNARGITLVRSSAEKAAAFESEYRRRFGRAVHRSELPERLVRVVKEAVSGLSPARIPMDLTGLPAFEREILMLLRQIPQGEVRPYLWLAREAGRPKAVRAVGNVMARNPVPFLLPCHRVVPASGGIGNYAFGSRLKRELLRREGVPVEELDEFARRHVRYVGSASTNIYCFPTCRDARRISTRNRVSFSSVKEAVSAGYRPCRRCQPEARAS